MPIPVSQIVTVNPAVVGTGGNPLSLNAVFLDDGLTTPVSSLLSFPDLESVGNYYGFNSAQYSLAGLMIRVILLDRSTLPFRRFCSA